MITPVDVELVIRYRYKWLMFHPLVIPYRTVGRIDPQKGLKLQNASFVHTSQLR